MKMEEKTMAMNKVAMNDDDLDAVSGGTILRYQVQPGDTLEKIAALYHVSTDQLMRWNNIQDPNKLDANKPIQVKF